jgi:hypothetical protein
MIRVDLGGPSCELNFGGAACSAGVPMLSGGKREGRHHHLEAI